MNVLQTGMNWKATNFKDSNSNSVRLRQESGNSAETEDVTKASDLHSDGARET